MWCLVGKGNRGCVFYAELMGAEEGKVDGGLWMKWTRESGLGQGRPVLVLGLTACHVWAPRRVGSGVRVCARVLCMHKRSLVYTQKMLLCIHNKCILIFSYYICYAFFNTPFSYASFHPPFHTPFHTSSSYSS